MTLIRPEYSSEMEQAANEACVVTDTMFAETRRRSTLLYAVLASMTRDKPQNIVRALRTTKNGYEAWRLIVLELEPPSDQRRLALAMDISRGKPFVNADVGAFSSQLLQWEELIVQYEMLPAPPGELATVFDSVVKRAVLLDKSPTEIREHLQRTMREGTTYAEMLAAIASYLRRRGVWCIGDDSMEIGAALEVNAAYNKDPKGKGKGDTCYRCGKSGHKPYDCPAKEMECRECGKKGHVAKTCMSKHAKGGAGDQKGKGGKGDQTGCQGKGGKSGGSSWSGSSWSGSGKGYGGSSSSASSGGNSQWATPRKPCFCADQRTTFRASAHNVGSLPSRCKSEASVKARHRQLGRRCRRSARSPAKWER